jgi:hypothetical protein
MTTEGAIEYYVADGDDAAAPPDHNHVRFAKYQSLNDEREVSIRTAAPRTPLVLDVIVVVMFKSITKTIHAIAHQRASDIRSHHVPFIHIHT